MPAQSLSEAEFFRRFKRMIELFEEAKLTKDPIVLQQQAREFFERLGSLERIMYPIHYKLYSVQYYRLSDCRYELQKRFQNLTGATTK